MNRKDSILVILYAWITAVMMVLIYFRGAL